MTPHEIIDIIILGKEVIRVEIKHEDLIGTFEQKQAIAEQFNLMDDELFAVVMKDKAACGYFLSVLLGKPVTVLRVETQYTIRNLPSHSVILDALVQDAEGSIIEVEVQKPDNDCHPKRVRYIQAAVDWSLLEKGKKYEELPELYLIFMSRFDVFKKGMIKYEIDRVIRETEDIADNGIHEIYFSTNLKDDSQLGELMQYMNNSSADNMRFGALSEAVKFRKRTKEGVESMSEAVRKYAAEQSMIAVIMSKIATIKKMLADNISLDTALMWTDLDMQTYEKYSNMDTSQVTE